MVTPAFVGIDVACAKGKRLPVVVGAWSGSQFSPLPLSDLDIRPPRSAGNLRATNDSWRSTFAQEVASYLDAVEAAFRVSIRRIAIDAPSAYRTERALIRESERALGDASISFFKTPTAELFTEILSKVQKHIDDGKSQATLPHANQLWMLVGFSLYEVLGARWECIEVYPQATVRALQAAGVLSGDSLHKSHGGVPLEQLRANSLFSRWPPMPNRENLRRAAVAPVHDAVDAYLAAFTAALDLEQRRWYGTPPHDAIWVPDYGTLKNYDRGDGLPGFEEIELDEGDEALLNAVWDLKGEDEQKRARGDL